MNDRWFDSRQLKCFYWDGKTDYKVVKESDEALNQRINEFGDWLEGQELPDDLKVRTAAEPDDTQSDPASSVIKANRQEKVESKQQEVLALQDYDEVECYGDSD